MQKLDLYNNQSYYPGKPKWKILIWIIVSAIIFESSWFVLTPIKPTLLRLFGAIVGKKVVVKPGVKIKYPWHLIIGSHTWIGERVWIDNLTTVAIGSHVCISQNTQIITGNHSYKKTSFDLMVDKVIIEDQVWIGAGSLIGPGVICENGSVLLMGSLLLNKMSQKAIYKGYPAKYIKPRIN